MMEGAKVRIVDTTTKEQNADSVHEPWGENSDWTGRANYYLENERTGAPSPLTLVDCSVWTDWQASDQTKPIMTMQWPKEELCRDCPATEAA